MSSAEEQTNSDSQAGWVVLSSRVPRLGGETPELAAHLVERIDLSKPPVIISYGQLPAEGLPELIGDLTGLLGAEPALLSTEEPPPAELSQVSLILLTGGPAQGWVELLSGTRLAELLLEALASGAVIVAAGGSAAALGSWHYQAETSQMQPGAGWVAGSIIMTDERSPSEHAGVRELLEAEDRAYALGLAEHTLVALGPGGGIEVWGESEPTIVLGAGWGQE